MWRGADAPSAEEAKEAKDGEEGEGESMAGWVSAGNRTLLRLDLCLNPGIGDAGGAVLAQSFGATQPRPAGADGEEPAPVEEDPAWANIGDYPDGYRCPALQSLLLQRAGITLEPAADGGAAAAAEEAAAAGEAEAEEGKDAAESKDAEGEAAAEGEGKEGDGGEAKDAEAPAPAALPVKAQLEALTRPQVSVG